MGLDAFVRCRCWEDGLCGEPPHAEFVRVNDEGDLVIELPRLAPIAYERDFDRWKRNACQHVDMAFAKTRIGNWSALSAFRWRLAEFGAEQFPTLSRVLPEHNGGAVDPSVCEAALRELQNSGSQEIGTETRAFDERTGELLRSAGVLFQGAYRGFHSFRVVLEDGRLRLFGGDELLFESRRFDQEIVQPGEFRFVDVETKREERSPKAITSSADEKPDANASDASNPRAPLGRVIVEEQPVLLRDFDFIVSALRNVFQASIQTGNPVQWL